MGRSAFSPTDTIADFVVSWHCAGCGRRIDERPASLFPRSPLPSHLAFFEHVLYSTLNAFLNTDMLPQTLAPG